MCPELHQDSFPHQQAEVRPEGVRPGDQCGPPEDLHLQRRSDEVSQSDDSISGSAVTEPELSFDLSGWG